ncbi:hypothetical protein BJ742DRAFT_777817 [Cladochytrium replicatum]|nr:hypothetical protein BJ742DRAFT_777817 [Cladochytrium replicatum]
MRSLESTSRGVGGQMRWYASARQQSGQAKPTRISAHGILERNRSFCSNRTGFLSRLDEIRTEIVGFIVDYLWYLVWKRKDRLGPAPANCLQDTQGSYIEVSKAIARPDIDTISRLVTPRVHQAPSNNHPGGVMALEQYTVQTTLKVISATYMHGKRVAGDPEKKELMKEYVVVESMGETGPWVFAGKDVPNVHPEEPAESTSA